MENKQYLESQYNINYASAMNYVKQGNHKDAIDAFKKSLYALIELMKITIGQEQRGYKNKADKIVEIMASVETMGTMPPPPPSPDIQYEFFGVNVKNFLSEGFSDGAVTFDDVYGKTEEKDLIKRILCPSNEDRDYDKLIGRPPKTFILLYGVPGTGKTFFANAIAGELKRNYEDKIQFFSVSYLLGCDARGKNIQALTEFCKQFERCVLFIDAFDVIAPDRKIFTRNPTEASRVTVNLQMLDEILHTEGILVIAATNEPDSIDEAFLSRSNARIEFSLPDYEVIHSTLKAKIGRMIAGDVDLSAIASRLERDGYSNRDIKSFIGNMVDSLSDEFVRSRKCGEKKSFDEYRYTNVMIEKAFEEIVPTTRQIDKDRIEQFKRMYC